MPFASTDISAPPFLTPVDSVRIPRHREHSARVVFPSHAGSAPCTPPSRSVELFELALRCTVPVSERAPCNVLLCARALAREERASKREGEARAASNGSRTLIGLSIC
eukprot:6198136-Pleurochrysis_carterae.AAC.2